jgi:predicted DCC family thiol-disulfide oxidoreductase YuxK
MATVQTTEAAAKKALVLYDGQCQFCQKSVAILRKLDWLGRLAFQDGRDVEALPETNPPLIPQRLIEEMHVVTPDRKRVYFGFGAFRWMAWRLPLCWPIAPLLYLPGIPWLGNRIYLWVARNRFELVPCDDGQCALPKPPAGGDEAGGATQRTR